MRRIYKVECVIIKRRDIGEADRLLTIFTRQYGKLNAVAKGIKKIHSKKAPHLELFTHVIATMAHGKNLDIIVEVETIEAFAALKNQLTKVAYAYRVIELVDKLMPEHEKQEKLFYNLLDTLTAISQTDQDLDKLTDNFSLGLLWELGFLPLDQKYQGQALEAFIESVIEKKLKSNSLIKKI